MAVRVNTEEGIKRVFALTGREQEVCRQAPLRHTKDIIENARQVIVIFQTDVAAQEIQHILLLLGDPPELESKL